MKKWLMAFFILLILVPKCHAEFSIKKIQPIRISTTAHGHGRVNIILTTERTHTIPIAGKYYQGIYKYRGQEYPVAASQINGTLTAVFSGKTTGSRHSRKRLYKIKTTRDPNIFKAHGVPVSSYKHLPCGADTNPQPHNHDVQTALEASKQPTESYRVITISTFADPEWVSLYGERTNIKIAEEINVAEALYERQLNIRFNIVSQDIFSSSFSEISSSSTLSIFRQRPELNLVSGSVKYLFSGRSFAQNVVGIAYIGSFCYSPNYAVGIATAYGNLTSMIFAHEFGHTLNAQHDVSDYNNIMYPSISWDMSSKYFTENSKRSIESFLSYFNSCLLVENLPPNLNGAKMTITRKKTKILIGLVSFRDTPISNQNIAIQINKQIYFAKTNIFGTVRKAVKVAKKKKVTVSAYVVDAPTILAKLKFRM